MSDQNDKKMRQMFRRHIREHLEKLTADYFLNDAPMFNDKPKWIPQKLWLWLIELVVDHGFLIQYRIRQRKIAGEVQEGDEDEDDGIEFSEGYLEDEENDTIEVDGK